jgi:autotransporter-associated beta strand protein/T5SS/PEP-CTERM-associated repeat protein
MQVSNMVVGAAGTGVYDVPLNQKMNYVVSSTLVVGRDATGAGTVTYSGSGSLLVTNSTQGAQLIVGQNGAGTFVLSSTLVADKLIVATNAASAGTFTWTSGTMSLREINGTVLNGGSPTSDTNTIINGVLNTLTTGNAVAIGTNSTQVYNWGIGWTNVTSFDNGLVLGVNTNSGGGWSLNGANQLMAVTNSSGTAKLIVGQSGYGVFTLNNAGATLLVDNLLVTNNTLTATNSFLNLTAGTLISGGATLVIPTNGVQSVGGTWLAKGNTWVTTPAGATANNALLDVTALDVLALDSSSVMVISNAALRLGGDSAKLFVTNGAVLQALGRWDSGGSGISSNYGVAIGYGANNATGVVAGAGSLLVVSNELAVSSGNNRSYNSLLITNGGKVVSGSGALAMYRATGHTGLGDYNTIQVLDSGSYWINQGNLVMAGDYAYGSNNQLIVANSGVMTNLGDVTIGTGSDSQYRNFNNGLQVTNGGLLYVGGGILAQDVAGIIVVRDNGSRLMANNLTNSAAGGNITVADNGQMTLQQLVLGSVAAATNNLLTVSGGSLFATNSGGTGALVVGLAGQGTLTLSSGAVTVNQLLVTNNALNGATNSVFNFDGGTLTTSNNAIAAQIVLADNAYFQINGTWNMNGGTNLIYSTGTATGTVYVGIAVNNATVNVGPNAVWSLGTNATSIQNLTIGLGLYRGNAVVVNGGLITNVAALNMGASAGGINFSWGSSLTISNGGKVFVSGGALTFPVSFYSSNNAVNVIGSGARLDLNGGAVTMGGSSGTLTISGGGVVKSGAAALGSQSGGNDNMVIVEGNGSAWTNTGLTIGFEGNRNSLIITNGGQVVSSGNIAVGSMGSANSILVAGTGSMLTGGVVTIGLDSAGNNNSVIVTNGGTVLSGSIVVGIYAGNNGGVNDNSVLIAGPGSSWTNSGTTLIKRGLATLSVSNGATFVSGDVSFGAVPEGTNQTYNVGGGANSVFVTNGAITIGFASVTAGNNAMNVTNATLLSGAVTIGAGSADNTVTVQNDATWDLLGNSLTVGSGAGGSNNTLTIQGGTVAATGLVMSATANGNVVNITGGTLFVTNSAGNSRFWVGQSGQGSVTMGGGSLTANYLLLTNSAASVAGYGWLTATAITNQGTLRASGGGNLIVDGVIAGAGTNYAENGGTLTLRGINTYTSPTWLNGGTVVITTNANLGPNSAPLLFYSGGTLQVLSNATLAASRSIVLRAGGGTIDTSNQSTIVAGVLDGDLQNVGGGLTKMGSGMLTLLETNTYTGATQIREGQVVLAQAGGLRASTISNAVHGGLVFSNVATAFNIGGLAGSGNIGLTNTAGNAVALTVGGNGESTRYSGALSGAGSLTVNGGILELTGNNHYTGVTIVTNGALNVNNATGIGMTGDVFVYGSGDGTRAGTLGGTGSIGGVVTVETGGRIAPGNSVGTLNVATLTLNSGSVLDFEFNPALLATNDKIIVGNAAGLTINGGQFYILREGFPEPPVEDLTAGAFFTRGTYNLIGYRGVIGGTGIDALSVLNQAEGYTYLFDVAGGYVRLTIGATNLTGWSGLSGTTSNWTDAANWDGDVPVSGSKLLFSGYTRLTNYNDNTANTVFNGITFDSTADKFMLTGNAIGLSGNVSNNSSRTQTINLDLALTGNRVFATTNKGGIVVNGNISDGGSGFGLIKTGGQRLTLTGVNTYTGVTEIQGGALQAAVADAGLPNASNLKINGGVFESSGTFSRSLGTGAGQVQWAGSGGFSAHGGDLSVNIGGAGGALKWNGTSGFVTDSQKLIFSFNAESATSYQPDRASNTVNMINPIDLNGGMRTVQVNNGHATIDVNMVNGFTNSTGTGGLTKTGSGAMLLSGTSTYDGNTVINGGELVMAGTLSSAGSVFVYAGGALMMDSGTVNTDGGVFINSGGYLGGNAGAIHDEVTVAKGGVLTPGMRLTGWDEPGLRETGALQVDRLTLQGGFKYNWELSLIGTDRVDVAALDGLTFVNSENWTLNLGLNYSGEDFGQGKWDHWFSLDATTNVYTLFTFNGAAPYDLTNNVNILGFEWYTNYARVYIEGNKVLLTGIYLNEKLMVIPEPSVVLLWLSSIATVVAARRRARRKAAA